MKFIKGYYALVFLIPLLLLFSGCVKQANNNADLNPSLADSQGHTTNQSTTATNQSANSTNPTIRYCVFNNEGVKQEYYISNSAIMTYTLAANGGWTRVALSKTQSCSNAKYAHKTCVAINEAKFNSTKKSWEGFIEGLEQTGMIKCGNKPYDKEIFNLVLN